MSMHSVENMIHIRSKDRHAHEGMCCFNVHMKEPIQVLEGWSATCQLSNAQIPFSHRPVNTYNNTLVVTTTPNLIGIAKVQEALTLAPGYYDTSSMAAEIEKQLNTSAYYGTNAGEMAFTVAYQAATNKMLITATSVTAAQRPFLSIDAVDVLTAARTTAWEPVGLQVRSAGGASLATALAGSNIVTLTGDGSVNVTGDDTVYFHCSWGTGISRSFETRTGHSTHLLAKIPILAPVLGVIFYEHGGGGFTPVIRDGPSDLQDFHIRLCNTDGQELELEGLDWECSLKVTLSPKPAPVPRLLPAYAREYHDPMLRKKFLQYGEKD